MKLLKLTLLYCTLWLSPLPVSATSHTSCNTSVGEITAICEQTQSGELQACIVQHTLEIAALCTQQQLASTTSPEKRKRRAQLVEDALPFTEYKDNYLLLRPDLDDAKFQLSVRYRLGNSIDTRGVLNRLYFGYTQTSFWNIGESSSPIEDHNFAPELFYVQKLNGDILPHAQVGWLHQSNGRDGEESRSWDRLYVQPHIRFFNERLQINPSLWAIIDEDSTNRDIHEYYGYFDIETKYAAPWNHNYSLNVRRGSKKGRVEFNATIPFHSFPFTALGLTKIEKLQDFDPKFYIQAWEGYGESLLNYNRKSSEIGIGVRFTNKTAF